MPIRIPQVVSQQTPDLGGTPRFSPGDADNPGLQAASRAVAQLGETFGKGLTDYQKIENKLIEQDNKLDVDMKLDEFRDSMSRHKVAMAEEGVEPTDLAKTYNDRGQTEVSRLMGELKYPNLGGADFQVKANQLLTTGTIEQRNEALQRLNARVSLGNSLKMDELSLDAVRAGAEAERQRDLAARYEREGEPELKQMALDSAAAADKARKGHLLEMRGILGTMTGNGIWGADKAEAETRKARTGILMGDLEAAFQNPAKATAIVSGLRRFDYPLAPEQQIKLADSFEQKERAEDKRRKDEIKEAEKELAGTADKAITGLIDGQRWAEARTVLGNSLRVLSPERVEHLRTAITNGEKGVKDDRDTVVDLQPRVFSVLSRVNPGQPKTDAEIYQDMAETDRALREGRLSPETHRIYQNESQTRLAKAKEDPQLARRHAQAEQDMRNLLTTQGALVPQLDVKIRAVLDNEMADLRRNSAFFGGKEDPFDWFDRRKAGAIVRVQGLASAQQGDLEKQMQLGTGQGYSLTGNEYADKQALAAQERTFRNPSDYLDQVRLIRDWYAIQKEKMRFQSPAQPLGGQRPAAGAPAPSGGVKTLGRPQGTP